MKLISLVFLTLAIAVANASPVNTFALVVDAPDTAGTAAEVVHSGQRLPASSELSVPADSAPVDLDRKSVV